MNFNDWLNLLIRWTHLIAGISWIGSSFYFIWLDSHLEPAAPGKENVEGELWMVHSGGFYQVERRRIGPGQMPAMLHWFKWEAAITWMSGLALLAVVYYFTNGIYLIDPTVARISPVTATFVCLGVLMAGWIVYDRLWVWAEGRAEGLATILCCVLAAGVTYGFCHFLSGRAAFIHVGALFGTIMVANVWGRILPGQQKMIDATREGRAPDFSLSAQAKRRSVHNSYMTFPVLFIMLSNHFPATYAGPSNWIILLLLTFAGAGIRHHMIGKGRSRYWVMAPVAAAFIAVVVMTAPASSLRNRKIPAAPSGGEAPGFAQVQAIVLSRCSLCHSASPRLALYGAAPGGVSFDDPENIRKFASRIFVRVVATKTMPLSNMTQMPEAERELLARWIEAGAPAQ